MKSSLKRTLALVLCVLAVFSLFPVTADAAGTYGALSSKKVKILYPTEFFDNVMIAKLQGGDKGKDKKGVYIVPRPETGNGDLGTVNNGSKAIILAEDGDYYFWMTTSGKLGWSNKKYFTEPEEVYSGYLWGDSGLDVDDIEQVEHFLQNYECGLASKDFYASRAVLVMKKGETKKISVHRKWYGKYTVNYWSDDLTPKWVGNGTNCKISIKAKSKGPSILDFSNNQNSQEFHVLIIVT